MRKERFEAPLGAKCLTRAVNPKINIALLKELVHQKDRRNYKHFTPNGVNRAFFGKADLCS